MQPKGIRGRHIFSGCLTIMRFSFLLVRLYHHEPPTQATSGREGYNWFSLRLTSRVCMEAVDHVFSHFCDMRTGALGEACLRSVLYLPSSLYQS
jgi:hypothetical protein